MNICRWWKAILYPGVTAVATVTLMVGSSLGAQGNGNSFGSTNTVYSGSMIERLDRIERVLNEPQVTATFCISQGRALDLAAKWALEAPVEWEGGAGWAEVLDGKVTWAPTHPTPIGLPTEAGVQIGGGIGRLVDICIDLPLQLGPTDTALLMQLAADINANPNDGSDGGKFQRRGHRLLNYAKRRIPGNKTIFAASGFAADNAVAADDEFDRVDQAIENLTSNGFHPSGEIMGIFRDPNVVELRSAFDGLPVDIDNIISNPEQVFDSLENFSGNLGDFTCADFGVTDELRSERPGLDRVCEKLESLPSYDAVNNMLSGQLLDGIAELIQPLLEKTSGVGETAQQTKNRFCASAVGQRRLFDRYCGR